jgi:DNA-directed RNA polymerase specialized sigma subunit
MFALNRLSADEQRGLCKQAQEGDRQALEALVRSVDGFIWKLAFFYSRRLRIDAEDLAQAGAVAAIKSVWRFNPKRMEAKFSTYACRAIVHAVCRNAKKKPVALSISQLTKNCWNAAPDPNVPFGGNVDLNRLLTG